MLIVPQNIFRASPSAPSPSRWRAVLAALTLLPALLSLLGDRIDARLPFVGRAREPRGRRAASGRVRLRVVMAHPVSASS